MIKQKRDKEDQTKKITTNRLSDRRDHMGIVDSKCDKESQSEHTDRTSWNMDMCCSQNRKELEDMCQARYEHTRRIFPSKRVDEGNTDNCGTTLDSSRKNQDSSAFSITHYERGVKRSEVPTGWTEAELLQLNKAVHDAATNIGSKRPNFFIIQVNLHTKLS